MTFRELVHEVAATVLAIVDSTASKWRWYRRWCGGHWERWWVDMPIASSIWLQNAHGTRPGLGVIREACEDWTPPLVLPSTGSPYRDPCSPQDRTALLRELAAGRGATRGEAGPRGGRKGSGGEKT